MTVGFLPISHSIPESSGLVIDTPDGRIVHTGDFKLDTSPVVGEAFDAELWAEVAKPGVKALVCDSTNVFSKAAGRSESTVGPEIEGLVSNAKGMVVATTFASNATETGVLKGFPKVVPPEDAKSIPRENLMLLVTGSQGERRAASAQLARGKYQGLTMKEGDMFLFSSKTIPGNERGVIRIINAFSEMGVDVVDDDGGKYHVSGHANRPELEAMHDLMQPQMVIPMHGEHRHLREHVKLANSKGRAGVIAVNGMMIDLSGNAPKVAEYIETGRTYLDGSVQIGALDGVVRDRIRMALNGHVIVTLILDEDDEPLGEPWCELMGLPELGRSHAPLLDVLEQDLSQLVGRSNEKTMADDDKLNEAMRRVARQTCMDEIGKKPEVTVIVSRLS
ncbi:Ribonuclease J [Nymphon striatum]|nr:Ribonuclease J [Nymphon striatum]